jgi:DNA-binding LacI/PurR family transcriptional regulator
MTILCRAEADLTSMNQSTAEQAGIAVNWVASRSTFLTRPARHVEMAPRLTVRAST